MVLPQVTKGFALEQLKQAPLQQVGAAKPRRSQVIQVGGLERVADQVVLKILAQKLLLKGRKSILPKGCVISRHDAAARHTADHIQLVEQADAATGLRHPGLAQRVEHAITKRGRACAPTRQADHQQHVAWVRSWYGLHRLGAVHDGHHRLVLPRPHGGARGQQRHQAQQQHPAQRALCVFKASHATSWLHLRQNCGTNSTITASNSSRPTSMPMVQTQV